MNKSSLLGENPLDTINRLMFQKFNIIFTDCTNVNCDHGTLCTFDSKYDLYSKLRILVDEALDAYLNKAPFGSFSVTINDDGKRKYKWKLEEKIYERECEKHYSKYLPFKLYKHFISEYCSEGKNHEKAFGQFMKFAKNEYANKRIWIIKNIDLRETNVFHRHTKENNEFIKFRVSPNLPTIDYCESDSEETFESEEELSSEDIFDSDELSSDEIIYESEELNSDEYDEKLVLASSSPRSAAARRNEILEKNKTNENLNKELDNSLKEIAKELIQSNLWETD